MEICGIGNCGRVAVASCPSCLGARCDRHVSVEPTTLKKQRTPGSSPQATRAYVLAFNAKARAGGCRSCCVTAGEAALARKQGLTTG